MKLQKVLFGTVFVCIPSLASALTLTVPTTSVNACEDYFAAKWADRLDMNNEGPHGDILYNLLNLGSEYSELQAPSCANGVCTAVASGNTPFMRVLTPSTTGEQISRQTTRYGREHPITGSEYRLLSFRLYSSAASQWGVRFDGTSSSGYTTLVDGYAGWHNYQIDLGAAAVGSSDKTWLSGENIGLGLFPVRNSVGTTVKLDWIQLTPPASSCSNFSVNYTATSGQQLAVYLDDNSDLTDGFQVTSGLLTGTGSSAATTFNSSTVYAGTYNVMGVESNDFATLNLNPWDMKTSDDYKTSSVSQISGATISGEQFCGTTTGTDPGFQLKFPGRGTFFDSSVFKHIAIQQSGLGAGNLLQVVFYDTNQNAIGIRNLDITGDGIVTKDLSLAPDGGEAGVWTGLIGGLRIDPGIQSGKSFCIGFVTMGTSAVTSEPSLASATVTASSTMTIQGDYIAPFVIPDHRGGVDYFTAVKNNPVNFDSTSDVVEIVNGRNAVLYPGKSYTDVGSNVRIRDMIEFDNVQTGTGSDGDPNITILKRETTTPIEASRFRYACVTYDLPEVAASQGHSVGRWGWELPNFDSYTSDDIIPTGTREQEHCVDLKTAQVEIGQTSFSGDYWAIPSQNNQVISFRFDPHEEEFAVKTRISDIRLAARHEANTQFAVVLGGDRDAAVSVYKNTTKSTSGGTLIGSLSANRTRDYLLWDTSAEADGTEYYLYSQIGTNKYVSDYPVVINRSYTDTTAPIVSLDAPPASGAGRYATLDLAGFSVDNVRLANIRVLVDATLVTSFVPTDLHLTSRDTYSTYPDASIGGFQKSISLSSFSSGSHTLTLEAVDTAGNITTVTRSFTKAADSLTSPVEYSVPNESGQTVTTVEPTPTPESTRLSLSANYKKLTLTATLTGASGCSTVTLLANAKKSDLTKGKKNTTLVSKSNSAATVTLSATKLTKAKSGSVYVMAQCDGTATNVVTLKAASFKSKKALGSVGSFIKALKKKLK